MENYFKGRHFQKDIILVAVGYYFRFSLSYRDVVEILRDRGMAVMAFLVNIIKNIGYFCARKPRDFFRISFSSDREASRFSIALISSGDLPD